MEGVKTLDRKAQSLYSKIASQSKDEVLSYEEYTDSSRIYESSDLTALTESGNEHCKKPRKKPLRRIKSLGDLFNKRSRTISRIKQCMFNQAFNSKGNHTHVHQVLNETRNVPGEPENSLERIDSLEKIEEEVRLLDLNLRKLDKDDEGISKNKRIKTEI